MYQLECRCISQFVYISTSICLNQSVYIPSTVSIVVQSSKYLNYSVDISSFVSIIAHASICLNQNVDISFIVSIVVHSSNYLNQRLLYSSTFNNIHLIVSIAIQITIYLIRMMTDNSSIKMQTIICLNLNDDTYPNVSVTIPCSPY